MKTLLTRSMALGAACLAAVVLFYGCPSPNTGVSLTLLATPAEGGTAEATPSEAQYEQGAIVQLTATPAAGWRFNRWVGLVAHPGLSSTTITMERDETVTAVFEPILQSGVRLGVEVTPAWNLANITLDPPPDPDSGLYREGTTVTLTADTTCCPGGGQFVRWEGAVFDPDLPITMIMMDTDQTVRAVIRPENAPDFQVTVSALPEGSGTVAVTPNQNVFFAGEEATVEATPADGYKFAFWIGDVANIIGSTTTFTANKDASVIAVFKPLSGVSDSPHAYLFGIPDGPLAQQIQEQFPNVVTEIGTQARGLIMPGSAIDTIAGNPDYSVPLNQLFNAGYPIVLASATVPQVEALEEALGVAPSGITLEPGEDFLAYFGIDLEPDGRTWRLAGHMPKPGDTDQLPEDYDTWRVQCISTLEAWILKDGRRAEDFPGADTMAKQAYDNLVEIAKADPLQIYSFYTYTDTQRSDTFVLTTFPYACHSLTGSGMDYFYVIQYGAFSGSGSYRHWECGDWCENMRYMYQYRMWTNVSGFPLGSSDITLYDPQPLTYSGADTIQTSGISWSIGGNVGVNSASGPVFTVNMGVTVSNSYTISIPDVSITANVDGYNQPQWTYNIRRAEEDTKYLVIKVPPLVSQGTFAPINQWLFVVHPTVRSTYPNGLPLTISYEALQATDHLDCIYFALSGQFDCNWDPRTSKTCSASQTFTVPWPPLAP